MRAGGSASIVESIFDVTGQVNYKVCRLSGDQLVYMDEDLKVGAWLGDETPSLPVSAAPQQAFLTQADFLGVRQEVRPARIVVVVVAPVPRYPSYITSRHSNCVQLLQHLVFLRYAGS